MIGRNAIKHNESVRGVVFWGRNELNWRCQSHYSSLLHGDAQSPVMPAMPLCFHIIWWNTLVSSVIILFNSAFELSSSVAAGKAQSRSMKFGVACQAVGGKVTLWSWNSSLVSAASPPFVSLSAAHINILWRSIYSIPKNVTAICGGKILLSRFTHVHVTSLRSSCLVVAGMAFHFLCLVSWL